MARCQATTKKGTRCSYSARDGSRYCGVHAAYEKGFTICNTGRSKKWDSVEQLQKEIDKYFRHCDNNKRPTYVKSAKEIIDVPMPIPYTIEGLCDVLECTRDTLLNYEKEPGYEEFFDTIKKAKNKIQRDKVERGLMGASNSVVTIFDLKNNHGYRDQVDHSHSLDKQRGMLGNLFDRLEQQYLEQKENA